MSDADVTADVTDDDVTDDVTIVVRFPEFNDVIDDVIDDVTLVVRRLPGQRMAVQQCARAGCPFTKEGAVKRPLCRQFPCIKEEPLCEAELQFSLP